MNEEKIRKLANLTKEEIGKSEEDVKINFIVPLFEAFGHERLKFEHRWKDALVEKLDPSGKLVIETKNYDKELDRELQQLERYCNEERPSLGIIANGTGIRIFSCFWRDRHKFQEALIYCVNRKDLKEDAVINILENILSKDNFESGEAKKYVIEREKEIECKEEEIKKIEEKAKQNEKHLQAKIEELTRNLEEIKNDIEKYRDEKESVSKKTKERVLQIRRDLGFQQPPDYTTRPPPPVNDKSYTATDLRYLKMLDNPNSLPSKIKGYIDEVGETTFANLKRTCVEKFGCKSETSGSIGASVNILKKEEYIKIEGWGEEKRIISLKKT